MMDLSYDHRLQSKLYKNQGCKEFVSFTVKLRSNPRGRTVIGWHHRYNKYSTTAAPPAYIKYISCFNPSGWKDRERGPNRKTAQVRIIRPSRTHAITKPGRHNWLTQPFWIRAVFNKADGVYARIKEPKFGGGPALHTRK